MVIRVAVAGVSNGLGDAIASALLDHPDLEVVLLTRHSSSPFAFAHLTSRGATLRRVDYSSIPKLTSALVGVETVICTIFSMNNAQPTLNLIEAAESAGVRRFAPSEFAITSQGNARLDLYEPKRQIWAALEKSGLEYTAFQNGIFMDYFAFGAPKPHIGPFTLFPFVLNIGEQKATLPGDGNAKLTFTTIRDVGRFVAVAVRFEDRWPAELGMQGETTTYNQVIRDIEILTGKKIEVKYLDKDCLARALDESNDDELEYFYNQVFGVLADGLGEVTPVLNARAPQITPTSVKEFIAEYWCGDQSLPAIVETGPWFTRLFKSIVAFSPISLSI